LVTSQRFARLALAVALAAPPLVAGCATTRAGSGAGAVPGAPPALGAPPVRAETRLGNGIRVVIEENHLAPLVAVQVWVASGAADDPPALAGAAHFYEHLVLRGGKRRGAGGGAREIESVNGSVGAWTGLDETVYHAVVAAPFFELGLDVLADAIANPNFDAAEVDRVRKLALDEIGGAATDTRLRANQALFAAAFAGDRHARPVLGTAASVASLTPAALAAHFPETHGAAALTVVVVGDVDGRAIAAVERAFAAIPAGRAAPPAEAVAGSPRAATVTSGGAAPAEIIVGFRTKEPSVKAVAALDLLAAVLARGEGARMQREIVRNRQLADGIRPFSFRSRTVGLVAFAVTPAPRRIAEAAEATLDFALRAALEPVTDDELAAARVALEGDLARTSEGPLARARRLGFAAAIAGDADDGKQYLDAVARLGPEELRRAAADFLTAGQVTIAVALPDGVPAGRDETVAALTPRLEAIVAAAPTLAEKHGAPVAPAVGSGSAVRVVTPGGVRVLVVSDGSAPLVSVQAAWVDRADAPGAPVDDAAPAVAALLEAGTRTRSRVQVADEARAIGGVVRGFAVPGTLGLRADFLPQHLQRGLALVADCLAHPVFAEREVDAVERSVSAKMREESRGAEGDRAALRLFRETLSPDAVRRAENEPPPALGRFALLDRYRRRYPLSRLIVAVVGNVDPAAVVAALATAFPGPAVSAAPVAPAAAAPPVPAGAAAPAPAAAAAAATSAVPAPAASAPVPGQGEAQPTSVFRTLAGTESSAVVGYPLVAGAEANRLAVELLAELLGGEGGRVPAAFADERTLGCRTNTRVPSGPGPGYLAVTVTCPPARLDAAVSAVRAALARTTSAAITPDEVGRAARRLIGARAAALRTRMAVADALVRDEASGLPLLSYRGAPAALARITAGDVARAAQAILDPKREVIAVVHPPSAAPALARTSSKPGRSESER
jgi:zinc protease